MKIGIDIDDTLTNTDLEFKKVMSKYVNSDKGYKDKLTTLEYKIFLYNIEEIMSKANLKEDAKDVLYELRNLGHKLYIITARSNKFSKNIEDITMNFIKKNNLKFDKIIFNQQKKSDIAKKLELDLMIDDNIDVYNNMKEENINCILFGDKIRTWKEVLDYIKRM